ncbi:enoyl-CoA hydratase/isomerase family protein [Rhodococcus sp. NPDC059968]|uniref:enoyl-CoA hydratase/isomerase family protein n=1 Tax=Rhodococcus sp. NPDC059968 TaxID=3347017 RepID=UPI00366DD2AE
MTDVTQLGSSDILYEVDELGIATITLSRPDTLNALTTEMLTATLPALCREVTNDDRVKVVVITGAGRGFCSGADVKERIPKVVDAADATTLERAVGAFVQPVWSIPKPVIAAVNGVAGGGGMSIACAADFRFLAQSATFVAAFVRRGMMPDSGLTYLLPRLIPRSRAARILMTGATVTPNEALQLGLADEVVPDAELNNAVHEFAAQLAAGPAVALSFTKRAIQRSDQLTLEGQLEFESWGQHICFKTADFAEGLAAFAERRTPVFKGR